MQKECNVLDWPRQTHDVSPAEDQTEDKEPRWL